MKWRGDLGLVLGAASLFLFLMSADAQTKKGPEKVADKMPTGAAGFGFSSSRGPIDIQSDTVEANQKQNSVVFKGNVVAKQEDATLHANLLTIHYDPNTKKLKDIVASGNVKIVQLDRRATGNQVVFDQDENKVVLEGDAVLREGDNVIRGERVIYYVNEERSIVEGGKGGRVNTTITPTKKDEKVESSKQKGESGKQKE